MPPNIENLKPWPKGVSGNPGGRAKGPSARTVMKQILAMDDDEEFKPKTKMDRWALNIIQQSPDRDTQMDTLRFLEGNQPPPETEATTEIDELLDDEPEGEAEGAAEAVPE